MNTSKLSIYLIFALIFLGFEIGAQEHYVDGLYGRDISMKSGTTFSARIDIEDQFYQCMQSPVSCLYPFQLANSRLYTKLFFDDALRNYYSSEWKVSVDYTIDLYDYQGNANTGVTGQLSIDYHPSDSYQDIDLFVYQANATQGFLTRAELIVTNVTVTNRSGGTISNPFGSRAEDLAKDIYLELHLEVDRVYDFDPNQKPDIVNTGVYLPATQELRLHWDYIPGAEEYDLEWLFVDMTNKSHLDQFQLDFSNATRITTNQNFYKFSLAYPRGYLIYRVRGIGKAKSNPSTNNFDKRLEGAWSYEGKGLFKRNASNELEPVNGNPFGIDPKCQDFYFWNGLELDKNWQFSAVYAEEGKKKESINFYDDIMKPQQTATVLNTDETVVVSEPVYDYLGRNTLQVLPAPQKSQGIRYYSPIHRNNKGDVYSYRDFDYDSKIDKPAPLSSANNLGAGYYFSAQNTKPIGINGDYVPDASGYPYSRTTHKIDGSGRVNAVSGMGKAFFDGPKNSIIHETRFYYSSPFQEVLFMLFGNEVGHAKYYEQVIAVDANGQASASIKDLSGRVVATSLVGDAPDNLLDIDTKPDQYRKLNVQLSPLNQQNEAALIVNKVFTVIGNTRYEFSYQLESAIFDNCGVRSNCVYDLLIYIVDEYGNRQRINWNGNDVDEIIMTEIRKDLANTPIRFSSNLSTGSYQVVKELTLNQTALDKAVNRWKKRQECLKPRKIESISTCNPNCEDLCRESYISPRDSTGRRFYLSLDEGIKVAEADKDGNIITVIDQAKLDVVLDSIRACQNRCEKADYSEPLFSECDLKYELLKQDMSPGGQYFDNLPDRFEADGSTLNAGYNQNGWLEKLSNQDLEQLSECLQIPYDRENSARFWLDIRASWQAAWADILITYHPEWCAFETLCCAVSECTLKEIPGEKEPETVIRFSYKENCDPIANDKDIQQNIRKQIKEINFDSLSKVATKQIEDPGLQAEFSAQKLKERATQFFEDYYRYTLVQQKCEGLYLNSPNKDLFDQDGFMIRYPQNPVFEAFDPLNPGKVAKSFGVDVCKEQAENAATALISGIEDQCGEDALSKSKKDELWTFAFKTHVEACQNPEIPIEDINQEIIAFIQSNYQLSVACYRSVLPVQTDTLCSCNKINDFVYEVMREVKPALTYEEVSTNLNYARDEIVQDALDLVLGPDETTLKANFVKWLENCNDPEYVNWLGGNEAKEFELAAYFQCDTLELNPPCDTCCSEIINSYAQTIADMEFERLLNRKALEFRAALIDTCLKKAFEQEIFNVTYDYKGYHYTLYYYDQAGDLVKTIPPEGLFQKDPEGSTVYHESLLTDTEIAACYDYMDDPTNDFQHTYHLMITNYQYNSLQNVIAQNTPDGGKSNFFYDALGRLVVSQNAVQRGYPVPRFSYLNYDQLGRTIEAGELESGVAMTKAIAEDIKDYNIPISIGGQNALLNWLATNVKKESTYSFYDGLAVANTHPIHGLQKQLRNRISTIAYDADGNLQYDALTHYSYDVLGSVETMWQENRNPVIPVNHQIKRFDYQYDLVSGNVNAVDYQYGQADMLQHRFAYDADNRLTGVWTSTTDIIWDQDVRYFYYAHGPLAREEIGDLHVFANDYIYDIRGWITAMNASMVDAKRDAGKDGVAGGVNENFGRDPFAFSLHYFQDHYKPIKVGSNNVLAGSFAAIEQNTSIKTADTKSLYNGNISIMVTSMKNAAQEPLSVMANAYKYDQLNRIKSFKPFWDQTANTPLQRNDFDEARNESQFYNSSYIFDGNGNIHRLERNGITGTGLSSEQMDNMRYAYDAASAVNHPDLTNARLITTVNAKKNNHLHQVADAISTPGYEADIESGQSADNYKYDAIGRLLSDAAEEISQIEWNVSNKITEIVRPTGSLKARLQFAYGPLGNRTWKTVLAKDPSSGNPLPPISTWYILDAQGNPMAFYTLENGQIVLKDFVLYGNKRLGLLNVNKTLAP